MDKSLKKKSGLRVFAHIVFGSSHVDYDLAVKGFDFKIGHIVLTEQGDVARRGNFSDDEPAVVIIFETKMSAVGILLQFKAVDHCKNLGGVIKLREGKPRRHLGKGQMARGIEKNEPQNTVVQPKLFSIHKPQNPEEETNLEMVAIDKI